MPLDAPSDAKDLIEELLPLWQQERTRLDRIDNWARWNHDDPHKPKNATPEYRELQARAQTPWGDLIVSTVAQTLYVEGYRRPDAPDDATGWTIWQANGMDGRQVALHRATLTYGYAFGLCLPGKTLAGDPMPTMRGVSPREMYAVYEDPAADDWPIYALKVRKTKDALVLSLYDDQYVWRYRVDQLGGEATSLGDPHEHEAGVVPVVRYKNRFDLEGRATGEVEPFIPLLGKIDQTSFDRLVVQRFASWIVRTIAGMVLSDDPDSAKAEKLRVAVEDILIAEDPDTKFGSLPATQLDGFIKAHDSDLADLAAVAQTPAYELLGQLANLSADALAAARASLTAKSQERQHTLGEDHEQFIRLACHLAGDTDGSSDFLAQVRWADTSIRSLTGAADALGKLRKMLDVPAEMLWGKIPGFTQQDVDEAKRIVSEGGELEQLLRALSESEPVAA